MNKELYDKNKDKNFEFSKIIFLILCSITIMVVVFSILLMWKTSNLTPLAYLIPSVFTSFATGTAFYFDKSKKENMIKLREIYGNDLIDKIKED